VTKNGLKVSVSHGNNFLPNRKHTEFFLCIIGFYIFLNAMHTISANISLDVSIFCDITISYFSSGDVELYHLLHELFCKKLLHLSYLNKIATTLCKFSLLRSIHVALFLHSKLLSSQEWYLFGTRSPWCDWVWAQNLG